MATHKALFFLNQSEGEQRLLLFWKAAIPLRQIVNELPQIEAGFPMNVTIHVPTEAANACSSLPDVLGASTQSQMNIKFPNLSEPHFERLALRFRPFFATKEETNFLRTVNEIAYLNVDARNWLDEWRTKWKRAVFWGAMGMPKQVPALDPEKVIAAGFYAGYFHFDEKSTQLAQQYQQSLGKDMFRVAVVSTVWQRARIITWFAEHVE